jgi:MoaA/NifB/PqqE/SkfB family radical SAM enzyme
MAHRIDNLRGALFISWQITRDCDLACLHCCTESAPGKRLPDELDRDEAMRVAREIIRNEVPYVMLCGGEPLVAPHFFELAEALGAAGIQLKIETNGQRLDDETARRLARLPVRSIQVSLDGDSQEVYERQRPGGSLARAHAAGRAVRAAGMPLEVTFAPTRLNLHEAPAVIRRARELGAFRFNSGRLMRVGTAARHWPRLAPPEQAWQDFQTLLRREAQAGGMEICFEPFSLAEGLRKSAEEPPATLLVLPNGWVKVAAALPDICADLRRRSLADAWRAYQRAWREPSVEQSVRAALTDESRHRLANSWQPLNLIGA